MAVEVFAISSRIPKTDNGIVEVGKRYSVFYFIGSIASALSGILAYGLQQMEGVNGIRGWRWSVHFSNISVINHSLANSF